MTQKKKMYCLFVQETEVQGVNVDLLLLLALYREITLANASPVQSPKSEEVRKLSISLTIRLQYVNDL